MFKNFNLAAFALLLAPLASLISANAWSADTPTPAPAAAPSLTELDFDRFEDGQLFFKGPQDPRPLKTDLQDLKYLGVLRTPPGDEPAPPYFLFSARPCKDCMQDLGIYAVRAGGGKPTAYVYPGKIVEPKSHGLVLESRAFFGRCLFKQKTPIYVVFQKERVDRRKGLQSSVFVAEPAADHMLERLIERRMPRIQDTLKLVKAKQCKEIDGRNRVMTSRLVDLRVRAAGSPNGAQDDDDTD